MFQKIISIYYDSVYWRWFFWKRTISWTLWCHRVYFIQTFVLYATDENIDGHRQVLGWETLDLRPFSLFVIIISFFYKICSDNFRGKSAIYFQILSSSLRKPTAVLENNYSIKFQKIIWSVPVRELAFQKLEVCGLCNLTNNKFSLRCFL